MPVFRPFQKPGVHGEAEPRRRRAQEEHARQDVRADHAQHGARTHEVEVVRQDERRKRNLSFRAKKCLPGSAKCELIIFM